MYEWRTRIRYSETGTDGILTIAGLINLFQDTSNFESEDKNIGLTWLTRQRIGWIILKWQVDIKRMPALGEEVILGTSPYDFKTAFAMRNFFMKDASGEVIACADSMWLQINLDTLKPIPITEEFASYYTVEEKYPMNYTRGKILPVSDERKENSIIIGHEHLDSNNHVNNGQYISMALHYADNTRKLNRFMVEYRNQAFLGDVLIPYVSENDSSTAVSFRNKEDVPFAAMIFCYE